MRKAYPNLAVLAIAGLACLSFLYACPKYGSVQLLSDGGQTVTVGELQKSRQDYVVYYSGWPGDYPVAMIFDPKGDDRTLICEAWIQVLDEERLDRVINRIKTRYEPRLYKILGPDGQFYGYLFSGTGNLYLRSVDERTIRVFDVHMPSPSGP